jgi:uncharacterized membrane protein YfcA
MDARFSLTGLLVGFLIGLTGMGGGSLTTPLLILVIGVRPTVAVGSDLAYSAVTKIVGAFQHHRQGTVNHRLAWRMSMGSVPGALLGVWWVQRLQHRLGDDVQQLIVRLLGLVLILVAFTLLLQSSLGFPHRRLRLNIRRCDERSAWTVLTGLVLGLLVGVTSVGSGTLFGVVLLVVFGLSSRQMVGTDLYHAAILTTAAAGAHLGAGNVDYRLVANLLLGSIPGVLVGSRLAARMPESALRPLLAGVLLLAGLRMN